MSSIKVKYSFVDGAHFFTGGDEYSHGLCVAHTDLKTAYEAVGAELAFLMEKNYSLPGKIEPKQSFEKFQAWVATVKGTAVAGIEPIPAGKLTWATNGNTQHPQ